MSVEKAKEFLISLSESEEAAAKADDAYVEALLKAAEELGHTVEEKDLRVALDEMFDAGELTDEELELAAGGTGSIFSDSTAVLNLRLPFFLRKSSGKFSGRA